MGRKRTDARRGDRWVEAICGLPLVYGSGEKSIRQHFEPARARLGDRAAFLAAVGGWLRRHPDLIDAWQRYCEDKRTAGPCLDLQSLEVGVYEASTGRRDVRRYANPVDCCAEFIYREAIWVLGTQPPGE
jgi:hypothetical protein